jgi:general secretion pathway protein I
MTSTDAEKGGFAVLEALVALAILTGTAAAVFSILSASRIAQARAEENVRMIIHAQSLLARVGLDIPLQAGHVTGSFDDGQRWLVEITPFSDERYPRQPGAKQLFDVRVHVPAMQSGAAGIELRTLRRQG